MMQPGYTMNLSFIRLGPCRSPTEPASVTFSPSEKPRFSSGFPLSRRSIRFEDEKFESSNEVSEATMSCLDAEDAESSVLSAFDDGPPSICIPGTCDRALVRSRLPLRWTDRAKNCVRLVYRYLHWLGTSVLFGCLFVHLTGIGSEILTNAKGSVDYLDPNNIISDLLLSRMASLHRYFEPLQNDVPYNNTSNGGPKQQAEDFPFDTWDRAAEGGTTRTEQAQSTPPSTYIAYIDWIDHVLGWKGVKE